MIHQTVPSASELLARTRRFPSGATLSLADLAMFDRFDRLAQLRASEPMTWFPELGCWLATSREAARTILAPAASVTVEVHENMVRNSLGAMMLTTNDPEHTAMRQPFEAPFRNRDIEIRYGETINRVAHELIDTIESSGDVFDLNSAFASPFAVLMAGEMLGLNLDDTEQIHDLYDAFASAMEYSGDPEPLARAERAREQLNALLHKQVSSSRANPDGSVTSVVVNDPSSALNDNQIVGQLRVVLFGAVETIQASVMNTLYLLMHHTDAYDATFADRSLLAGAQEEARRLIPPVAFIERWSASPMDIAGVDIGAGEFLGVSVAAANRDPDFFDKPDTFDIFRSNASRNLSFSFGIHACLGLHMARAQTFGAIAALWDRLGAIQLIDSSPPDGFAFRRPGHMTVTRP